MYMSKVRQFLRFRNTTLPMRVGQRVRRSARQVNPFHCSLLFNDRAPKQNNRVREKGREGEGISSTQKPFGLVSPAASSYSDLFYCSKIVLRLRLQPQMGCYTRNLLFGMYDTPGTIIGVFYHRFLWQSKGRLVIEAVIFEQNRIKVATQHQRNML